MGIKIDTHLLCIERNKGAFWHPILPKTRLFKFKIVMIEGNFVPNKKIAPQHTWRM